MFLNFLALDKARLQSRTASSVFKQHEMLFELLAEVGESPCPHDSTSWRDRQCFSYFLLVAYLSQAIMTVKVHVGNFYMQQQHTKHRDRQIHLPCTRLTFQWCYRSAWGDNSVAGGV